MGVKKSAKMWNSSGKDFGFRNKLRVNEKK